MEHFPPADPKMGLTTEEAARRRAAGLGNQGGEPPTKSVGAILRANLLTPFNGLNLVLAILIILVGSWRNLLFMGVILCNIAIGIFQELRAKATIDRLSVLAAAKAHVRRDGRVVELPLEELVLGDILILSAGNQVGADCQVEEGSCRMDESLLTGESDGVARSAGDTLLSGSFLLSGSCVARVIHVGADNYAAQITAGAKRFTRPDSEIMATCNRIIRTIAIFLVPIGVAMFVKQQFFTDSPLRQSVVSTVAALIGLIPEGLILLTSVVLAVSVIRLARRGALVQELYSIEMLARVDVVCLDKTGTLTTGALRVEELAPLEGCDLPTAEAALESLLAATGDENPTASALAAYLPARDLWTALHTVPFQSEHKWSAASFGGRGTWVLGAPRFLLPGQTGEWLDRADRLADQGLRVLLLAHSPREMTEDRLPDELAPAALVVLSDGLRPGVEDTMAYFVREGVTLKVISGDDPRTVSAAACRAGVPGAESWVDASTLSSEEATRAAAEQYTVFGRVTPRQKLWLVQALKAAGHHVAMTGDGVNDVPALKESDCGVAMAAGSEAARNVSRIVLMDSDFSAMPHIVSEGRRAINNLQRSAALFLTKTIFSALIAVAFLILTVPYPFQPIQLSLISTITIGLPSFLLALEPNRERVRGRFRDNVFSRCIPGGVTMAVNVLLSVLVSSLFPQVTPEQRTTLCVLLVGFTGLVNLFFIARPMNLLHTFLVAGDLVLFVAAAYLLRDLFAFRNLPAGLWLALLGLMVWTAGLFTGLWFLVKRLWPKK